MASYEKMDENDNNSDAVEVIKNQLLSSESLEKFRSRFKDVLIGMLRDSSKVYNQLHFRTKYVGKSR